VRRNQLVNISPLSGLTSLVTFYADDNEIVDIAPLSGLTNLTNLSLNNNQIVDITPLSGLTNLTCLFLDGNQIVDIQALVDNTGLRGESWWLHDVVHIRYNCLDLTSSSDDRKNIQTLIDRGVRVEYEPQNEAYKVTPEIAVQGRGVTISDGDNTPFTRDDTDFGSADIATSTVDHTFTIRNMGAGDLNLTGTPRVSISGAHAVDFSVISQPISPIGNGKTRLFMVRFNPSAGGIRTATISIANNDADENPYNFAIQGTGIDAPEMDVSGLGNSIEDGDATPSSMDGTDFGTLVVAERTCTNTFTITNSGNGPLNLTGTPRAAISGTNAADFTLTLDAATPVASGGDTTTFTITFNPSAGGVRTATISIANNDANENPYNFAIQGTGTDRCDIDANGEVDVLDVQLCLQISLGTIAGTADQRAQADVDLDGDVDLDDAKILAEFVLGIRTTLPGGESP